MPIKLDCPRCKKPLGVPSKKAGSYATCPHCNGRFWVPDNKETGPVAPGDASAPAANREQPPQPPPAPVAPTSQAPTPQSSSPPPSPSPQAPAPQPPAPQTPAPQAPTPQDPPSVNAPPVQAPMPGRKVARFVSAEAAQSTLCAAEDGQLPALQLQQSDGKKTKQQARERTISPAVLFVAISLSAVLCLMMALYDTGSPRDAGAKRRQEVRVEIEKKHFADAGVAADLENAPPLKPYQRLLREAQRAYERKDYRTELRKYHEVLDLLRQEQGAGGDAASAAARRFEGLTGSAEDDKELELWIRILLKED
ncbi:MAG: hypothetical protein HQ567_10250 [Candidatus Nealsonbacteria bacterium]|nr:hypothetical protein [Candidatus Nealsonbacteria bacterium]